MHLRPLLTHWRLSLIAILSLATAFATALVGLGVFDALLMRPPGVPNAGELATLFVRTPDKTHGLVSYPEYAYYRDNNDAFIGTAAVPQHVESMAFTDGDRHEYAAASYASSNFFDVLNLHASLGILRFPADNAAGPDTAVMSHAMWTRLGADPTIVGRSIRLNRHPVTVIGVAPARFSGMMLAFEPDIWMPLKTMASFSGEDVLNDRRIRSLMVIGRLRPGVSRDAASAQMTMVSARIGQSVAPADRDRTAFLVPTSVVPADTRPDLMPFAFIVLGVVGIALVAACANVTNLAASMATVRHQEMLIRSALGASRRQLIVHLLNESLLTSLAGGVVGFGTASIVLAWLSSLTLQLGPELPRVALDVRPDSTLALMAATLVIVTGIVTGILPALRSSRLAVDGSLNRGHVIGPPVRSRLRSMLVVIQVAAATLVVIAVGWSVKSIANFRRTDPGFSARDLVAVDVDLNLNNYTPARGRELADRVRERLASWPGVEAVTIADGMPLGNTGWGTDRVRAEPATTAPTEVDETQLAIVDANYLSTIGARLVAGREFADTDGRRSPEVVIVNQTLAARLFGGENPIGRRVRVAQGNRTAEVVGVAADGRYSSIDEAQAPFLYLARTQHELEGTVSVIARTSGGPETWRAPLSRLLRDIDPSMEFSTSTFESQLRVSLIVPRITLFCVGAFGAVALLLAMAGLFGAIYHSVSTRKREMGVRVALGATPRDLFRIVLAHTARLAGVGAVVGAGLATLALPIASSLFFGISPADPSVLIGALAATLVLATATAYAAARPWVRTPALELLRDA